MAGRVPARSESQRGKWALFLGQPLSTVKPGGSAGRPSLHQVQVCQAAGGVGMWPYRMLVGNLPFCGVRGQFAKESHHSWFLK